LSYGCPKAKIKNLKSKIFNFFHRLHLGDVVLKHILDSMFQSDG